MILGIDEVGRGSWAGPLVVGAAILGGVEIESLTDSKLMSKKKRLAAYKKIQQTAHAVGIGWVSAPDIDTLGLSKALKVAAARAVAQIDLQDVTQIIIDGTIALLDDPRVTTMKKADLLVPSCSAASVMAKVARDAYMAQCDDVFPGYGFASHVGYGAARHRSALLAHGVTPLHRKSFAPIQHMVEQAMLRPSQSNEKPLAEAASLSSTRTGHTAEQIAQDYLIDRGYHIIDANWRTKWCEVDIIAEKDATVYFVEVKYRKSTRQGGGVAAITPAKLRQMRFAAELWLQRFPTQDGRLSCIEVTGNEYTVTQHIESIE